ncbi:MAG: transposase [Candidatus Cloacimonetes bacterium]|nr:transposase [Candidatus Cloacimonadota bacterium]MBL7149481.1 transposase [Candidatus Cloacimonadota bacterium]
MPNYKRMYAQNHPVFITINTYKRRSILINNFKLLQESWKIAKEKFKFNIFAYCVLPDHIHLILEMNDIYEYPKIIGSMKWHFSKNINTKFVERKSLSISKQKKREKGIWQRRYYEHTIRDDKELAIYTDYIHYNPVKHGWVKSVQDWKNSSFYDFVKEDIYDIEWGSEIKIPYKE